MTLAIVRKDLAVMWASPIPWVVGALFHAVTGILYTGELTVRGQAVIQPLFPIAGFLLLILVPVVTMRSVAEETRTGTLDLLQAIPVPASALALGKWLAAFITGVLVLAPSTIYVAFLYLYGEPDAGPIASGFAGLVLLVAAITAVGVLTSSITGSQPVAAMTALFGTLILWFAHLGSEAFSAFPLLTYLSLSERLHSFAGGGIDTADVGFFLVLTAACLVLATLALDARRLR
jgi:ABC-2 type transport system permease protein